MNWRTKLLKVDDATTIAGQPSLVQFLRLKNQGHRSVVNLRLAEEWDLPLTPEQTGNKVQEYGLSYLHAPMDLAASTPETVKELARQINRVPAPKLVYDSDGQRSCALVLIAEALKEGQTSEEVMRRAEEIGCILDDDQVIALIEACLPAPDEAESELEGASA